MVAQDGARAAGRAAALAALRARGAPDVPNTTLLEPSFTLDQVRTALSLLVDGADAAAESSAAGDRTDVLRFMDDDGSDGSGEGEGSGDANEQAAADAGDHWPCVAITAGWLELSSTLALEKLHAGRALCVVRGACDASLGRVLRVRRKPVDLQGPPVQAAAAGDEGEAEAEAGSAAHEPSWVPEAADEPQVQSTPPVLLPSLGADVLGAVCRSLTPAHELTPEAAGKAVRRGGRFD